MLELALARAFMPRVEELAMNSVSAAGPCLQTVYDLPAIEAIGTAVPCAGVASVGVCSFSSSMTFKPFLTPYPVTKSFTSSLLANALPSMTARFCLLQKLRL